MISITSTQYQGNKLTKALYYFRSYRREVRESLVRADEEGKIVTDNLVLEINSSKHAW